MSLSRLNQFLRSVRGNIIYVDPNSIDSTDSIENTGNSLARPFKSIQRSLIEASRFSYQKGLNNDRFGKTTILLYPGDHIVDNRPGWIPLSDGINYQLRSGETSNNLPPFDSTTNFNLESPDNSLYKLNSIHGGVIVPRGTSIVGLDLRKTKIRPKYVPNPTNDDVERSAIFRVTGGCYFWQFSIFDADPNGQCFKDYTDNIFVPNFSHHKLSCFEYADGTNPVLIEDEFLTYSDPERTDLDMYYEKIGKVYGFASGRAIEPDYPSASLDIQPKVDEYRIVGSTGLTVGITSIFAGNGSTSSTTVTVTTEDIVPGLEVDTPIRIEGVSTDGYNGSFVVDEKISPTQITYTVQNAPVIANPAFTGSTLSLSSDTVTSASPYIFNLSLRSVYGMCGVLADGNNASGFKSMVIAQFTGIGLQKDDNAFVVYNETTGVYEDNTIAGNETISTNSRAIHKPAYRNFHIRCINDAFIQNVSIFAIGYAEHFSAESGGDQSVTNSNSNFGAKSLVASGFRKNAFPQDDYGYITHIIPPKEISNEETTIEFNALDVNATANTPVAGRLYLYNQSNVDTPPEHVIEGYRFGARENDTLKVLVSAGGSATEYSSRIVMTNSQTSSEKSFTVGRSSVGINSISSNIISLTQSHTLQNGESVRILSETGELPDGIKPNTVYYAITSGLSASQLKVAKTFNDANGNQEISLNNKGGQLTVVSRVSDKIPGELGHPVQYDTTANQWYVSVSTTAAENEIYTAVAGLGTTALGSSTSRTYIKRKKYGRNANDSIYRVRYVVPANTDGAYARPPSDGFIIQESNDCTGATNTEIQTYFGAGSLTSVNQQRNFRFIANAEWSGNTAKITTELPHNLKVGDGVEIVNVVSTANTAGESNKGFNREYSVVGIASAKQFNVGLSTNPGTFANDTSVRTTALPYFKRKEYNDIFYIHRNQEAQRYINGEQDGIYYLTLLNASNSPNALPFTEDKFSQPVKELYPQINRDNPTSDPDATKSFASSSLIGEVVVDDVRKSITKETINKVLLDSNVGIGITNIVSSSSTSHTVHTSIDHGLNRISKVTVTNSGAGYDSGGTSVTLYNVKLVGFAGSTTGDYATAKVTITPSGDIGALTIMDGGSAYGIGNTLTIVGVATTTPFVPAVIEVTNIYNNVGDTVRVVGVTSSSLSGYNNLYRITDIPTGSSRRFTAESVSSVSNHSTSGIGSVVTEEAFTYLTGQAVGVSSFVYNNVTGLATVTTNSHHGFAVGNKIKLVGATSNLYNGDFVITKNVGLTTFVANVGIATTIPTVSGTIYAYREGIASNDGAITQNYENLSGRMVVNYAGITTTLRLAISSETATSIYIQGINNLDIRIGDFLQIDEEIVRVKDPISNSITSTDPITVFRGVLGTRATTHVLGSVVRRVNIKPIELRRHSIIRASGHTFEYVGFGPGNYSTAFPDKQDRQISSQEELLAQSTRKGGGINFYTGMNDKGISYSGNKKLSTVTGQEEIFDTPVQTITGEDIGNNPALNVINPIEATFSRSIKVEGGEDSKAISEFNGPVVFSEKLTSTSPKGIEANTLFLQGEATVSRKYTVGKSGNEQPQLAGNPGDVQYNASPANADYLGWVYTSNNEWKRFAKIEPDDTIGYIVKNNNNSISGIGTIVKFQGTNITITPTFTQVDYSAQFGQPIGIVTYSFVGLGTDDILGGRSLPGSSGNRWFTVPSVESNGVMDIGRYIDFHTTSGDTSDYTYRLDNSSNGVLTTSGSLNVSSNIDIGGELNFTTASDKYIDFYTTDGTNDYTAFLRLVNNANTSFHNGISITRNGAVTLFHNNSSKLATATGGVNVTGTLTAGTLSGTLANTLTLNTSGTGLSGSTTFNNSGAATFTVTSNATSSNTASTIVARDSSGNFSAGTITANLSGNATTATSATSATNATNADNINISATTSSDTTSSIVLVGSQSTGNQSPFIDSGLQYNADTNTLTAGTLSGTLANTLTLNTSGTGLSGSTTFNNSGAATFTVTSNATSSNTASTIVARDSSGNFSAGTITCVDLNSTSDINLKENIRTFENAVSTVNDLNGVHFNWKNNSKKSIGVIAQEIEKILPELVTEVEGSKTVNYQGLVGVLIEAVKELSARVEELESKS